MTSTEPANTPATPRSEEKKILGMPVSAIMLAVLTAILGIFTGLSIAWWTGKAPHLTERVSGLIPFQGEKGETGILNVTVTNDGSKVAESIEGHIKVKGATIDDFKTLPELLKPEVTGKKTEKLNITLTRLNAGETLQISVLVKADKLPERIEAPFRATDVVAEEKPAKDDDWGGKLIFMYCILLMTMFLAMVFLHTLKMQAKAEVEALTNKLMATQESLASWQKLMSERKY